MFKKVFLMIIILFVSFSTFAQSPYGKILTLDNTGTQEWIDIGTVLANYISYHPTVRQPAWLPDGNTITGTEFIGTKNNQPLIFRTNNTENMRLTEIGFLGIGTNNPSSKLHVNAPSYKGVTITSSDNTGSGLTLNATSIGGRTYTILSTGTGAGAGQNKLGIFDEVAGQYRVVVDNQGWMGVGTTSPKRIFVVSDDFPIVGFEEKTSGLGWAIWRPSDGSLRIHEYTASDWSSGVDRLTIQAGSGNIGIGTTTPAEKLDVAGNVRFSGALMPNGSAGSPGQLLVSQGSNTPPVWSTVSFSENDPVYSSWINATGSTSNQILRFDGTKYFPTSTGNLTTTTTGVTITGGTGAVIGSGTTINIATASGTTTGLLSSTDWTTFNNKENALTFNSPLSRAGNSISIPQASGTTDGYLSSTDWTTFNNKLSSALNSGNIFVGNASNVATGVALTGDATITNAGVLTVTGLQARPLSNAAPTNGQVLTWNNTANQWEPQTPSSDWTLSGNSLTGSERIGSTNNQPVTMITNNTDRFRFTTKGQIEVLNSAQSVFLGEGAGNSQDNTSYRYNVFIGYRAGYSNTTGDNNTANGYQALYSNTEGYSNTASGGSALYSNTIGAYNTAIGKDALYSNTTGSVNTASGGAALYSNTSGNFNTASGTGALSDNTTGSYNTACGFEALNSNRANSRSTAIGCHAMFYADNRTTGRETYNTAVGYEALRGSTTASNNTGQYNTAIGDQALRSNTSGWGNTATGMRALYSNTTGRNNTAIGDSAGYNLTTGSNNILIGYNAQPSSATVNNEVTLGNSNNDVYRMYATSWTNASDARYKHNIADLPFGLDFILKLRPRQYIYNNSTEGKITMGFVAQEVQDVMKQYGIQERYNLVRIMEKDYLGLNTTEIIPILVKGMQEQQKIIENQNKTIDNLKQENEELRLRLEKLERIVLQGVMPQNTNMGSAK